MSFEMALQDVLQQTLKESNDAYPFSSQLKCAILNTLFDCQFSPADFMKRPNLWGGYFKYYHKEFQMGMSIGRVHSVVRTHQDISRIVELLRDPNKTRENIRDLESERLKATVPKINDDVIYMAIDLAARLGLMTLIGGFPQVVRGGERSVAWKSGRLDASLVSEFPKTGLLEKEHVKLEKLFNARSLERIAGLQIVWTHNLANHLRVQNEDKEVWILHYASFLESQKERWDISTLKSS